MKDLYYNYNFINLDFLTYNIKLCFIVLFSLYTYLKLTNKKDISNFKLICLVILNISISIFCGIIKFYIDTSISIIVLFILLSFTFCLFSKNTIGYSMIAVLISLTINYILSFISLFFSFALLRTIKIQNDVISLLFILIFHFLFIHFFFKKRRFKKCTSIFSRR